MEIIGTVIELRDGRALVETGGEGARPGYALVDNPVKAEPGDRVRVQVPELFSSRGLHLVYGLPLAGALLGALAGGLMAGTKTVVEALHRLGGPLLEPNLAGADNLALAAGLAGLGVAWAASVLMVRRQKRGPKQARIVAIVSRSLQPEPNRQ